MGKKKTPQQIIAEAEKRKVQDFSTQLRLRNEFSPFGITAHAIGKMFPGMHRIVVTAIAHDFLEKTGASKDPSKITDEALKQFVSAHPQYLASLPKKK